MVQKDVLYFPKEAKRGRWVVPELLRTMLLQYFHDYSFGGHLGAKTFHRLAGNFWWPKIRTEIFQYVKFTLCQQAKPAPNSRVGMHAADTSTSPLQGYLYFVVPLTRSKRSNIAILVVDDTFSKFMSF